MIFFLEYREVQPDPADVGRAPADGVGARVGVGGGDARLDQEGAILAGHGAAGQGNCERAKGQAVASTNF